MNEIIKNITLENYSNLKSSFQNSRKIFWDEKQGKLIHPGEYGTYRELLVKKFLRMYVPKKFDISSGFLINSDGVVSSQCDLVIYDKDNTPQIENIDSQKFFPIETVAAVGEVKSDINSAKDLNVILKKLATVKELRRKIKEPRPYYPSGMPFDIDSNAYSNIFTFLICNKFDFNFNVDSIDYEDVSVKNMHNIILSLENGVVNYLPYVSGPLVACSYDREIESIPNYLPHDNTELPQSVIAFISALCTALSLTNLLEVDIVHYLTNDHTSK